MSDQDVSIHIRLPAFLLDRVRQQAARRRRSVAAEIAIIVEDSMDVPAPETAPAKPVPARIPVGVPIQAHVTNPDRLLAVIREAVQSHGNPVQSDVVRPLYCRTGANTSTFYQSRDALIARGEITRNGNLIRLVMG
jgi:hypothetical protein